MKRSKPLVLGILAAVLVVGLLWYTDERREDQHREEYDHHVLKAFSEIDMAEHEVQTVLENWEKKSPRDISSSLLAISTALALAENDLRSLEGYLRYHDDAKRGGSTSFLSNLFLYYKQAVDARLRETWPYTNDSNPVNMNSEFWFTLNKDMQTIQGDLELLGDTDRSVFEDASMLELHNDWLDQASRLKFQEVRTRYEEMEGRTN
ncbi:hypothetical protein OS242_16375 [Tumebacillus sp. DT12]|uniref:Uncharacterized protein n=1 Tax=Tumebacillus lacus TaxID=2995335 RepID=A0ABT3X538_9BACL|nr:hypothetical protein [Tumebacillus lacus]MCX7571526.1 hypothetical protein [Tumebacillus lacus]